MIEGNKIFNLIRWFMVGISLNNDISKINIESYDSLIIGNGDLTLQKNGFFLLTIFYRFLS